MRFLHLSALWVWPMGGRGGMPSLRETIRGHVRGGAEVHLILPRYDLFADSLREVSVPPGADFTVQVAPCRWAPAMIALRAGIKRLLGRGELPFAVRWALNLAMMAMLTVTLVLEALKAVYRSRPRRRFDLVYSHNQYACLAGFIVSRLAGAPNVNRLYGTFLADLMNRPLVRLRYPVAAAGFLVPSDMVICGNDGTRGDEVARRLGIRPGRLCFWTNGVDRPPVRPWPGREEFARRLGGRARPSAGWMLSCSRLSAWKRTDRVLRAFAACRREGLDWQYLIAGDGPEWDALHRQAEELGLGGEVVWLGGVPHDDVWELMHLADIFVLANDVTNRCNPLYEAMIAGLPAVSVRDPATADLLEDGENALLAERDEGESLGRCLVRLCRDGPLRAAMRAEQLRRAEALWTWPRRMEAEMERLRELLRTKTR
jgi:glycosyltransferase involved in cell wall biosynthesis